MDGAQDERTTRRHPHRLCSEVHGIPEQVVFVTVRAKPGINLAAPDSANRMIEAMGRMAGRHNVSVHAYCIMPDHVHFVVSCAGEGGDIRKWIRYTKRQTAGALGIAGLWQRSYWDRHARKDDDVKEMVRYALCNPVRRELCDRFEAWPYSWSEWHPETRGVRPS